MTQGIEGIGSQLLRPPSQGIGAPAGACLALADALSAGDLRTATAVFIRDACLITPDATAVHGRQGIVAVLAQLIASRSRIAAEPLGMLSAADVTLVRQRWTIRSQRPDGIPFARVSEATFVLRRIEGDWKLALAAPWGAAI